MHTKNSFDNPRSRKGTRFIPVGGPTITVEELRQNLHYTKACRVEIHFANGDVLFNPSGGLEGLIHKAQEQGGDFRIVALPAESTAFPHVNVYGKIIMDEQAARESVSYPPRFPSPAVLKSILTSGRPITLVADNYVHRLPEIMAASQAAGDPATAQAIATFAASVERYKAGEMKIDGPLSVIFTTQPVPPGYIGEDTLEIHSLPLPPIPEVAPAPRVIPYSQPIPIKVPPQPRVPFRMVARKRPLDPEEFPMPKSPPVVPGLLPPAPPAEKPTRTPAQPGLNMQFDF